MKRNYDQYDEWDEEADAAYAESSYYTGQYGATGQYDVAPYGERGLAQAPAPPMPSLVGVSATVTNYGAPLLSYTRTMTRFYQARKQVLSMGRHKCAICGDRIGGWAWLGPDRASHAHDGCYEKLAWAWSSVYAEQQHMAARGELD